MNNSDDIKRSYYVDVNNNPKKNGIYCPVFDRWLLVDDYDYWVTLETARTLSSKIATMVYILPASPGAMTNDNCLNFSIFDKTSQKKGTAPDLINSQIPMLRVLNDPRQLVDIGIPQDYKNDSGIDILNRLKEYADFTHKVMYATMLCKVVYNYHDNKTFTDEFVPPEFVADVTPYYDRSDLSDGVLNSIKKIMYTSNTIDEAKTKISELWNNNKKVWWMQPVFYRIIGEGPMTEGTPE